MLHGVRWLEASYRNLSSRIKISALGCCSINYPCENICIEIRPRGWKCKPKTVDICGCDTEPTCPEKYMRVCAEFIDEKGFHVFKWRREVLSAKQGMYEAVVIANGCDEIAKLPLRIGPHLGAVYAEGPIHTNLGDCVTCDDAPDPCELMGANCKTCDEDIAAIPHYPMEY